MQGQESIGVTCPSQKKNELLSQLLDPQEVGSLVRSSLRTQGAAENCWREHLKRFEMMTSEEQLCTVGEEVGFIRAVSEGMYCTTGEELKDGFGNLIASCREYTLSRTHRDSEATLWIYKYTEIGPVLDVEVLCHHNVDGLEIQISSASGDHQSLGGITQRLRSLR